MGRSWIGRPRAINCFFLFLDGEAMYENSCTCQVWGRIIRELQVEPRHKKIVLEYKIGKSFGEKTFMQGKVKCLDLRLENK